MQPLLRLMFYYFRLNELSKIVMTRGNFANLFWVLSKSCLHFTQRLPIQTTWSQMIPNTSLKWYLLLMTPLSTRCYLNKLKKNCELFLDLTYWNILILIHFKNALDFHLPKNFILSFDTCTTGSVRAKLNVIYLYRINGCKTALLWYRVTGKLLL